MKHILVIFRENRKISTYPYLLNFIKLLSNGGYKVTCLINDLMLDEITIENVKFISVSKTDYCKHYLVGIISYFFSNKNNFDYLISFSLEGLFLQLIMILFSQKKIRSAYFSMEIVDVNVTVRNFQKWLQILWKLFHWILSYWIDFSVIQDNYRAELLKETLPEVCKHKIYILPNSYIGFSNDKSDYAYKKFGINKNKKILLYTGAIEGWSIDINLPNILKPLLDNDYVLLLSGFSRENFVENLNNKYKELIDKKCLIISLEILNDAEYLALVKSAYIGLAWYKKLDDEYIKTLQGKNVYFMGYSSGKLMRYLSCGIPVIVPDFYLGYAELMNKSGVGIACSYDSSILDGIRKIDSSMLKYRERVELYYKNNLEYSKQALPIIVYVKSLVK